jgi:hypothetical protein
MFVMICFALSWLPIIITLFLPATLLSSADVGTMKFAFIWLGIGGSSTKLLIFFFINPEFRRTFYALCMGMSANPISSESASYASLDFIDCCIPEQRSCLSSICCCLFCGCCICFRKACCRTTTITSSSPIPTTATAIPPTYYHQTNNRRINNSSSPMLIDKRGISGSMLVTSATDPSNNFINSRYIPEYGSFSRYPTTYATEGYR